MLEFSLSHAGQTPLRTESASEATGDCHWADLSRRIATGDSAAFEQFFEAYFQFTFDTARQATGRDTQTCLDIVQESMLKLMRCLKPLDGQNELNAFVRVVTRSVAYDWLRKETRRQRAVTRMETQTSTDGDQQSFADEEQLLWLEEQLQSLDPQLKQIIDWRYRWGWTLQTIASKLGLQPGAVDGRIQRALKKIRQRAEGDADE
jgi:RNA polymerase sigma factor (sigma-70 family)